jgi:hypothetical protein
VNPNEINMLIGKQEPGIIQVPVPDNKNTVVQYINGVYHITVSSSLIKKLYYHGNEEHYCPKKLLEQFMKRSPKEITSKSMLEGVYFETGCIGSGVSGKQVLDLPRKLISEKRKKEFIAQGIPPEQWKGEKTTNHLRIDEQIDNFKRLAQKNQFVITPQTTQVHKKIPIDVSRYFNNVECEIGCNIDIITSGFIDDIWYDAVCIDLKLAGNRNGGFGKFNWGNVAYMDHTQLLLYGLVTGLPQFYLLFDTYAAGMGHRFIEVTQDSDKIFDLKETIRKTIERVIWHEENGYEESPSEEECRLCFMNPKHGGNCPFKTNVTKV